MDPRELKQRTLKFAVQIIKFSQHLEQHYGSPGKVIARQIIRSGTGVYSNYRAACRCKSAKDFISKMGTEVEEADETLGWIELSIAAELIKQDMVKDLLKEADEITAIMTSSRNTSIQNHPGKLS